MLMLPKLDKGMKQAMTKLEKASKTIVGAALVVGLLSVTVPSNDVQAAITNPTNLANLAITAPAQGSMVLTPSVNANTMIASHYSHSSHSSHESHSSHYSHYSSSN